MKPKRKLSFVTALVAAALLAAGCSDKNDSSVQVDTKPVEAEGIISVEATPLEILTLTESEVKDKINSYDNLKTSDNLYLNIPQNAPVLRYVAKAAEGQDFQKYYKQFNEIFAYIFPERKIDENFLFYIGGSSYQDYDENFNLIRVFNLVKDYYDELVAGKEGAVSLLYDESWYRDMVEWKSPVCLEIGDNIGNGYAIINKGKTVELLGKVRFDDLGGVVQPEGVLRYPSLESFDPIEYFEVVGVYSPDSTESFRLSDGEVPINEAVDFYEDYINNLPYPENANLNTTVAEVEVLKVNDDTYGYYLLTTAEYQGIIFDYMTSGTQMSVASDYSFRGGNAFMIEKDEVDIVYGIYKLQLLESVFEYESIVPFDSALKTLSESLTDEVEFEVQKAELVYSEKPFKTEEGYIQTDDGAPREVTPNWKFTLFNSNDGKYYRCYVDAKDGSFRYFTAVPSEPSAVYE